MIRTKEHSLKLSLANKGKHYSPNSEFKKGFTPWNKGKKNEYTLSEETKRKIGLGGIGRIQNETTKKKISEANLGRKWNQESKNKLSLVMTGKKHTIEQNKKLSESQKGEKSHFWKGGIHPINLKIRQSLESKLWKKACMERDDFTCAKTGQRGGNLHVHHINNFADFPELRTSIENGITLSDKAHRLFHKIYGKRNNTKEQLQEFLNNKNI